MWNKWWWPIKDPEGVPDLSQKHASGSECIDVLHCLPSLSETEKKEFWGFNVSSSNFWNHLKNNVSLWHFFLFLWNNSPFILWNQFWITIYLARVKIIWISILQRKIVLLSKHLLSCCVIPTWEDHHFWWLQQLNKVVQRKQWYKT